MSLSHAVAASGSVRRPVRPPRLDSLSGIRPVASLMVFAVHVNSLLSGRLREVVGGSVGAGGGYSVTFFFVLSGFVLAWTARPGDTATDFWRRRFARIYPVYLLAFVLGVLVTGVVQGRHIDGGPAVASLFLVQAWFPTSTYYFSTNGVAWALSCEAFFYLVFPFAIGPLLRLGRSRRRALQVALATAIVVLATIAAGVHLGWLAHQFPVAGLCAFLLGCTVAIDVSRGEVLGAQIGLRLALVVTVVVLVVVNVAPVATFGAAALPVIPFLLVISAGARRDLSGRGSVFASSLMVRAAGLSFCFYLTHQLVIKTLGVSLRHLPLLPGAGLPAGIAAFVISVGFAWVLHTRVERPAERVLRGRSAHPVPVTVSG